MLTDAATPEGLTRLTRLARDRGSDGEQWLQRVCERRLETVAMPAIEIAVETGDPIGRILAGVLARCSEPMLVWRVMFRCDRPGFRLSVPLREVAWVATLRVLETASVLEDRSDEEPRAFLAHLCRQASLRLAGLGDFNSAIVMANKAVEAYRKLAAEWPGRYLSDLGECLNNLGGIQHRVGLFDAARQATLEALEIYQKTRAEDADAPAKAALAQCLDNLGLHCHTAGRFEESIHHTRQAVTIYRQLAGESPELYRGELATTLSNLTVRLRRLGPAEAALSAATEAVDELRLLVAERPDVHLPDLAAAEQNLGTIHSDLGEAEEARQATRSAVSRYRQLAGRRPEVFAPDLADCLNNFALLTASMGRVEESLDIGREAVAVARRAANEQVAEQRLLATCLHNLGSLGAEAGLLEEALIVTREAVELRRRLADAKMVSLDEELAASLSNLGGLLRDSGRPGEALPVTTEAVETLRGLAKKNSEAYREGLARALMNQSLQLEEVSRFAEAVDVVGEAIELRRQMVAENPLRSPALAASLYHLGTMIADRGDWQEAWRVAEEGVRVLKPIFVGLRPRYDDEMEALVDLYLEASAVLEQSSDDSLLSSLEG